MNAVLSPPPYPQEAMLCQVSQADVFAEACPSRSVLTNITSRWGVLVLLSLRGGTLRYSQIRRKIGGVSEKMLAQTLQALERDGFVLRVSMPVVPPHVEYSLTPIGQEVSAHVQGLTDWIEANLSAVMAARSATS